MGNLYGKTATAAASEKRERTLNLTVSPSLPYQGAPARRDETNFNEKSRAFQN